MSLRKCRECKNQVSSRAATCPRCGAPIKKKPGCLANLLAALLLVVLAGWAIKSCGNRVFGPETPEQAEKQQQDQARRAKKWYQGGTLYNKSALEWQTASSGDKLATCGDFVTAMWQKGNLKPPIANNLSTVDDVRPYAQELVDFLDAAFKPDPDPEQNRKMFTNQTVSGTAAIGIVTMGWTE